MPVMSNKITDLDRVELILKLSNSIKAITVTMFKFQILEAKVWVIKFRLDHIRLKLQRKSQQAAVQEI